MRSPVSVHRRARVAVAASLTIAVPVALSACTDDSGPPVKLSAEGTKGKTVAARFQCQNCHSVDGDELTGPTWKGLLGSKVTLKDGSVTTVDTDYLIRAVREPNAQRRDDATGQMPTFDEDRLSDEELAQVVAYITDLSAK